MNSQTTALQRRLARLLAAVMGTALAVSPISLIHKTGLAAQAQTEPPAAIAPLDIHLTLQADTVQQYAQLLDQAIAAANAAVTQAFSSTATQAISLTVTASRNGQVLPVLTLQVSQREWQQQPGVQVWAQHSSSTPVLLGLATPSSVSAQARPASRLTAAQQELAAAGAAADALD